MKYGRLKFALIILLALTSLLLFYKGLKLRSEKQWDKESKLYIQGYLDGKKEVLDSIKNQ